MKKNNTILNINISEEKEERKRLSTILNKLDSIGAMLEKVEAFNQLINIKLDEVKEPNTRNIEEDLTRLDILSLELFTIKRNIDNYIMLSYSITDYILKINEEIKEICNTLNTLDIKQ